jgi:murein DD-endopeptidase MepM/ murein hydrolase activator NlpD
MKPLVNKHIFWAIVPFFLSLFIMSFIGNSSNEKPHSIEIVKPSDGFDFPVGKPDAKGYYNAQKFGKNNHLGDDWNGTGGGNTDYGDPVYSVSNGTVTEAVQFYGGWGKVIRVAHEWNESGKLKEVESLYAHMDTMLVKVGDQVNKGQLIGKIGNAEGIYYAHLHLEIRDGIGYGLGGGYSADTRGYLDPTAFIKAHRKIDIIH